MVVTGLLERAWGGGLWCGKRRGERAKGWRIALSLLCGRDCWFEGEVDGVGGIEEVRERRVSANSVG